MNGALRAPSAIVTTYSNVAFSGFVERRPISPAGTWPSTTGSLDTSTIDGGPRSAASPSTKRASTLSIGPCGDAIVTNTWRCRPSASSGSLLTTSTMRGSAGGTAVAATTGGVAGAGVVATGGVGGDAGS